MSTTIPSKEAVVVILDVGKSMTVDRGPKVATPLEGALKAVNLLVQQKLMFGKKDELGFVLCGTKETENALADNGGYEHITVAREITTPDLDLLRYIEKIVPGKHEGDLIDALVVALDMLNRKTGQKKYQRRIFLVTDAGSPVNDDGWDKIVAHFKKMDVRLNIIGIDFGNEEEKTQGRHPNREKKLRRLANEVEGVVVPVHQALEMMSYFRSRSVLQRTTFRGALEITPLLKIGVWAWAKSTAMKMPSLKKLSAVSQESANPTTMAVQLERTYTSLADPDQTIAQDEIMKGYKYGKSLIPFPKYDEKIMAYAADKCLQLIGFTDSSSIPRHHFMGITECISADPADPHAARALSAFIHALAETDSVAIVRFVKRAKGNPHLGVLSPHIKAAYECLYYNTLPFSEDLRQYQFAPLAMRGSNTAKKQFIPNDEQLDAAQRLIDSLDLTKAAQDDEGNTMEALKPRYTYNPALQRFYQCVQHRALSPDTPLPRLDPVVEQYVNPDERLFKDAAPVLKEFAAKFPLEKTERAEKTRRKFWGQQTGDLDVRLDSYVPDAANKKRKLEGQDFSLEKLVSIGVNDVGSINPVQDFKDMLILIAAHISRRDVDLVDKAIEQMKSRIIQLVNDSIRDQFYGKAMECLAALREGCILESESGEFNKLLTTMRSDYEGKRRDDFWQFLTRKGITLIHCDEADDSEISPEEAAAFLSTPSSANDSVPSAKPAVTDDVDDLFDQIE